MHSTGMPVHNSSPTVTHPTGTPVHNSSPTVMGTPQIPDANPSPAVTHPTGMPAHNEESDEVRAQWIRCETESFHVVQSLAFRELSRHAELRTQVQELTTSFTHMRFFGTKRKQLAAVWKHALTPFLLFLPTPEFLATRLHASTFHCVRNTSSNHDTESTPQCKWIVPKTNLLQPIPNESFYFLSLADKFLRNQHTRALFQQLLHTSAPAAVLFGLETHIRHNEMLLMESQLRTAIAAWQPRQHEWSHVWSIQSHSSSSDTACAMPIYTYMEHRFASIYSSSTLFEYMLPRPKWFLYNTDCSFVLMHSFLHMWKQQHPEAVDIPSVHTHNDTLQHQSHGVASLKQLLLKQYHFMCVENMSENIPRLWSWLQRKESPPRTWNQLQTLLLSPQYAMQTHDACMLLYILHIPSIVVSLHSNTPQYQVVFGVDDFRSSQHAILHVHGTYPCTQQQQQVCTPLSFACAKPSMENTNYTFSFTSASHSLFTHTQPNSNTHIMQAWHSFLQQ
jgi:hypothetical protein